MSPIITPTLLYMILPLKQLFSMLLHAWKKLAEETDSFIAIQHQDPNSEGTTVFLIRPLRRKVA